MEVLRGKDSGMDVARSTCREPGCRWRLAKLVVGDDIAHDLMDMGDVVGPNGEQIRLFKHYDTRRYLNLSAAGECIMAWQYVGERGYVPMSLPRAVEHVFS